LEEDGDNVRDRLASDSEDDTVCENDSDNDSLTETENVTVGVGGGVIVAVSVSGSVPLRVSELVAEGVGDKDTEDVLDCVKLRELESVIVSEYVNVGVATRDSEEVAVCVKLLLVLNEVETDVDTDTLTDVDFDTVPDGVKVTVGLRDIEELIVVLELPVSLLVREVVVLNDVLVLEDKVAEKDPLPVAVADIDGEVDSEKVFDTVPE
jgi:hypothetical protein